MKTSLTYLLWLLLGCCLYQCAPEATGTVADGYHNTTAQFNGYFLARETMKEAENEMFQNRRDNYNRILPVILQLDTTELKGFNKKMEECIKTAAFAIERHPNSKWIDDCYVLVGKARHYLGDYANAITTYKYVNGNATDDEARQMALIELMRTYIRQDNLQDADIVKNFLRKNGIAKINLDEFYQIQAHFYSNRKDYERMQKSLALALPVMSRGERKARTHFIQGQLLQRLGNEKEAYQNYKRALKNNPSYELRFYTQLALLITLDFKKTTYKRIEKTFNKMLKDEKNIDYQDKVYYEMSTYELKRNRLSKAVEYLKKSIEVSTSNTAQKGYSFLRLGKLHFERLQEYELAKAYYDSTIMFLPKDEENYEKIAKRQKVLGDFVGYITTVQTEDSLQRMAQMSEDDLEAFLDENLTVEVKAKRALAKAALARQNRPNNRIPGTLEEQRNIQNSGGFYFANTFQVEQGKLAFRQKWGDRALTDNWRVADRAALIDFASDTTSGDFNTSLTEEEIEAQAVKDEVERLKKEIKEKIPRTQEQIAASNKRIEDAIYNLGKIYHFQLEEYVDALKTYEKLLTRFPQTQYEPEVLYLLYLASKEVNNQTKVEKYKQLVFSKYPNSTYTQLIKNPNFLEENKAKDQEARELYSKAYTYYERKKYALAQKKLEEVRQKYPNNTIKDKIDFLSILCLGREGDIASYKKRLEAFSTQYPESELTATAKKIIKDLNNVPNP
ncbi:MAG: tetratricopeptide repeat protein [Thermonemataceae bacterium]